MTTLDILKWLVFIFMLIGWAVMYAMDTVPSGWDTATLAILGLLYGLPAAMKVGSKVASKISFK